jgi:hypothetical protein
MGERGRTVATETKSETAQRQSEGQVARSTPGGAPMDVGDSLEVVPLRCCTAWSALLRWTKPLLSADGPFKSDQDTFDAARPDAALDFNGCDRLELPALGSLLVEHILKLFAGHLAAEHALAELDHCVLVSIRHARTILGQVLSGHASRATAASSCLPGPRRARASYALRESPDSAGADG